MNSSSVIFIALLVGIGLFLGIMAPTLVLADREVASAQLDASEIQILHQEWSIADCQLISEHVVVPGMTEEMVVCSWGLPTKSWRAGELESDGTFWYYGDSRYPDPVTLLFRGGVLVQYHDRVDG